MKVWLSIQFTQTAIFANSYYDFTFMTESLIGCREVASIEVHSACTVVHLKWKWCEIWHKVDY